MKNNIIEKIYCDDVEWFVNNIDNLTKDIITDNGLLHYAVRLGKSEISYIMFNKYPGLIYDNDDLGFNPLHLAVNNNDKYLVDNFCNWLIINNPPKINAITNNNYTYLSIAINNSYISMDIISKLISCGIDLTKYVPLDRKESDYGNYYHLCIKHHNINALKYIYNYDKPLFKQKCNVNDKTKNNIDTKTLILNEYSTNKETAEEIISSLQL
jgi:ankyrin repeat protein